MKSSRHVPSPSLALRVASPSALSRGQTLRRRNYSKTGFRSSCGASLLPSSPNQKPVSPRLAPAPPRLPLCSEPKTCVLRGSKDPGVHSACHTRGDTGPARASHLPQAMSDAGPCSQGVPSTTLRDPAWSLSHPGPLPSRRWGLGAEAPQADDGLGPPQPAGVLLRPPRRSGYLLRGALGGPVPQTPPPPLPDVIPR